jgi:hypothetical protein
MRVANHRRAIAQTKSSDPDGSVHWRESYSRLIPSTMGPFGKEKVLCRVYFYLAPQGTAKRTISRRSDHENVWYGGPNKLKNDNPVLEVEHC